MNRKFTITDKVDNIAVIPKEYLCLKPPPPKSIKIELNNTCNFRCSFCYNSKDSRPKREMDWNLYTKIIDEMVELNIMEAGTFFLGEGFMCKWLPDAIKYAKDAGIKYVFNTTNGGIATPNKVKACMEAGLDSLKFSLNYTGPEQLKEIARVSGKNFNKIINNIKEAFFIREEGGYNCGLFASSIRYNDEQFIEMQKVIDELEPYLDEIYFLPLFSQSGKVTEEMEDKGYKPTVGNFGRWGAKQKMNKCFSLFTELRICCDFGCSGAICCFSFDDDKFNAGSVKDLGIMGVWHSQKYQDLRQAMLNNKLEGTACEDCMYYT